MASKINPNIKAYDKFAKQYAEYSYSRLPQYELDTFISMIPKNSNILDAACGAGRDIEYFIKEGFKVTGIDLSKKLIEEAKKRVKSKKAKFKIMDLEQIKLKKNSFDGIWCCNALSHIKKDKLKSVLEKFKELLKKDGLLYFDLTEGNGEKTTNDIEVGNMPRKFYLYSQQEIEGMLKDIGFFINSITPIRIDDIIWINIFARKLG